MKYLEPIKLVFSIILIVFGLYIGILSIKNMGGHYVNNPYAVIAAAPATATYFPFYAGLCIFSGAYLLSKINRN